MVRDGHALVLAFDRDAELGQFADEVNELAGLLAEAGVTPPRELQDFIDRVRSAAARKPG